VRGRSILRQLKIERGTLNVWQSYGGFNNGPGTRPAGPVAPDRAAFDLGNSTTARTRSATSAKALSHDDSIMYKYHDNREAHHKAAASLTLDAGCE